MEGATLGHFSDGPFLLLFVGVELPYSRGGVFPTVNVCKLLQDC